MGRMSERSIPMRVTYDGGAGYVYLVRKGESSASAHQVALDRSCGYSGDDTVVLDFDADWRLVGIEVLDADRSLPRSVMNRVKGN